MATLTMSPNELLPAAKASGRCPPSLIRDEVIIEGGVFEMAMLKSLDLSSQGLLLLGSADNAAENFTSAMKMASGSSEPRILEQRRCLLLAALGSTAESCPANPTLNNLLNSGLLLTIKGWFDELLDGKVGGIDLLLHFLTNISPLPVTKDMVTSSRLGKTVSSVEKHNICVGSSNETAIKSRIQQVKERWSASVKSMKKNAASAKRPSPEAVSSVDPPLAKKAKRDGSSLSNLLKKVEHTNNTASSSTETPEEEAARLKKERDDKLKEMLAIANAKSEENNALPAPKIKKKDDRRIHWADSKGKALTVIEGESAETVDAAPAEKKKARKSRWAERKKKDIEREKELLLKSRKGGSADEKDDELDMMAMMAMWRTPNSLPQDPANPPLTVTSNEVSAQNSRMLSAPTVTYASEADVPISPNLISEVEKALEIVNTSAPNGIPFFTPQAAVAPVAAALSAIAAAPAFPPPPQAQPPIMPSSSGEATLETVLMMGLPLFLVGSNVQALQALASNPSLLASFKDVNGVYKQSELINLVQTLSQNLAPQASQQPVQQMPRYNIAPAVNTMQAVPSYYQPPPPPNTSLYSQPPPPPPPPPVHPPGMPSGGYRGDQNVGDANLHVSGYGPMTSVEEIKAMFAPYVYVTEVVTKSGFSFVNTIDAEGAKRAKEALNGSLLGGMPCRINNATRKAKNPKYTPGGAIHPTGSVESLPRNSLGQIDFMHIKDDRGNSPTKNLFIAGYGQGTTEQQIREAIGQYATIISVVMKGTFSFVNTTDKAAAVVARTSLSGQPLNGGILRVNFAKETGRLGTSFDSTYGGGGGGGSSMSIYGR